MERAALAISKKLRIELGIINLTSMLDGAVHPLLIQRCQVEKQT